MVTPLKDILCDGCFMKTLSIMFVLLLSVFTTDCFISYKNISEQKITHQFQSIIQSIKQQALPIAIIPILLYHHQDIINFITYRPYTSSLCFYVLLNYLCDALLRYQEQEELCSLIATLKKICFYLVIAHGIKNFLHQKNFPHNAKISLEDQFLDTITQDIPYSFEQATFISLKLYQEMKNYLLSLNISLSVESEEFVFLCHASSIDIQTMLYLAQQDSIFYEAIYKFQEEPQTQIIPLTKQIQSNISQTFAELSIMLSKSKIKPAILL